MAPPSSQPGYSTSGSARQQNAGTRLVSPRNVLPDRFQSIFPYPLFNVVQSRCFDLIYNCHDNVVVCAPTGSGKTALFELAICRLVAIDRNFKVIYQAPTKALCIERMRDWAPKFRHMNLKCAEITGDTSADEMRQIGAAAIIVTTPEKWDSITRKWPDHRQILAQVKLFLVDEIHALKDTRGATLEAVMCRMKAIGSKVRFVAVSATIPNSDDIAEWLGRNCDCPHMPAHCETFGEDMRPVKLQKHVYGYGCQGNDFVFDRFLDQKLPPLVAKHGKGKPALVFCFTRKSCESTADALAKWWSASDKPWKAPTNNVAWENDHLRRLYNTGVVFHHAGLDPSDRSAIEAAFLKGDLPVICCTSTLAVGINLPCHAVFLKGTSCFTDGVLKELSDIEVMQMLGRAGRPQFEGEAIAVICTRNANKSRYERMVSGHDIIESTLHLCLIEHLNSEVALGTIHDMKSAMAWLQGSFMNVRLRKNPAHYNLNLPEVASENMLESICLASIDVLKEAQLIEGDKDLKATGYGKAMSKYLVRLPTMKLITDMGRASTSVLLSTICQADELKEIRLKPPERALFQELNKSPLLVYPIPGPVTQGWHKISLLLQGELGSLQHLDTAGAAKFRRQLLAETKTATDVCQRLLRCIVECKQSESDSVSMRNALDLARSLAAGAWEGRANQLTQIPGFGPAAMRRLIGKGVHSVLGLAQRDHLQIEALMGRNAPFGMNTIRCLANFPQLALDVRATESTRMQTAQFTGTRVRIAARLRFLNQATPRWLGKLPGLTFLAETDAGALVFFWRGTIQQIQKGLEKQFEAYLKEDTRVMCYLSCDEIVGTITSRAIECQALRVNQSGRDKRRRESGRILPLSDDFPSSSSSYKKQKVQVIDLTQDDQIASPVRRAASPGAPQTSPFFAPGKLNTRMHLAQARRGPKSSPTSITRRTAPVFQPSSSQVSTQTSSAPNLCETTPDSQGKSVNAVEGEPEWVAEVDPYIVNLLRGCVTFI